MAIKEICGCIHLHTTYSDGGCTYPELIRAACGAGLDYICVTDHMTLEGRVAGYAGLHEARGKNVFVVVGYEHNDINNCNHYLAFGTSDVALGASVPQDYIDRVKKMGGIGFLAHPAEKRGYTDWRRPYPWTAWEAAGFDGIEIWNQVSDWMEQLSGWLSVRKIAFTNRFIRPAPPELLSRWDELNRTRFVSAIGSVDGHSWFKWGPFRSIVFHVRGEMRGIRHHLYVDGAEWGDAEHKELAILAAMKNGRGFMSNYYRGDARGSRIYMRDGNSAVVYPGRTSEKLSFPMTMNVELPKKAHIKLLRNGSVIQSSTGKNAAWPISEPGVYRIEAYRGGGAWIYSNPFPVGQYPL
jgi:hypothetical protein